MPLAQISATPSVSEEEPKNLTWAHGLATQSNFRYQKSTEKVPIWYN